jgi:hypothetical protein
VATFCSFGEMSISGLAVAPTFPRDRVVVFSELSDRDKERMFTFLLDNKIEVNTRCMAGPSPPLCARSFEF